MATNKSEKEPKYSIDTIVIADLGGSGDGYVFGKVLSCKPTKKSESNGRFVYTVEGCKYPVEEYYLRKATKEDLRLKKIFDEQNISEFNIDDTAIKRQFWESQREPIKKATSFINEFLYPYLLAKKHVLPVEKMTNWDSFYKKGFRTKNDYIFAIPHDNFNIIVQTDVTNVTLFITKPGPYLDIDTTKNRRVISIITLSVSNSDDECVVNLKNATCEIIKQLERGLKEGYYNLYLPDMFTKHLYSYREPLSCCELMSFSGYFQNALPGGDYTRALFDLSIMKYHFFGSNFNK